MMNTMEEIKKAFSDYRAGKLATVKAKETL